MTEKTVIELTRQPALVPAYLRAVTRFGGDLKAGETIPPIQAMLADVKVSRSRLRRYARVCGFGPSDTLPVTYPHVLAFGVHMTVLTHPEFPLNLLGLVHVRNEITQFRRIGVTEVLRFKVRVDGHREVDKGVEFDLLTDVFDRDGRKIWTSKSTMLARGPGTGKRSGGKKKEDESVLTMARYATWHAPADIGRRYALAAGDVNPIHLSALSAKLFGFARAIAHGMWLKARTAAEIAELADRERFRIYVAFKRPVLLPSPLLLKYKSDNQGVDFVLTNPEGDITQMIGGVAYR